MSKRRPALGQWHHRRDSGTGEEGELVGMISRIMAAMAVAGGTVIGLAIVMAVAVLGIVERCLRGDFNPLMPEGRGQGRQDQPCRKRRDDQLARQQSAEKLHKAGEKGSQREAGGRENTFAPAHGSARWP